MSDPAQSPLVDEAPQLEARNLFGVLGFAFFLAWTISVLTNHLLFVNNFGQESIIIERGVFQLASLVMVGISILISYYSAFKSWMTVFFVALIIFSPLAGIAGYFMQMSYAGIVILWFISGLGSSILVMLWGTFLSTLRHNSAILYPAISIGIMAVLIVLNHFLIEVAQVSFVLAFPLISLVFCLLERRARGQNRKTALFSEFKKREDTKLDVQQPVLWRSVLGTLCNCVCLGFALYFMATVGEFSALVVCSIAVIIACLLRSIDYLRKQVLNTRVSLRLIAPYAAICLLPLAFIYNKYWLICCGALIGMSWLLDMVSWSEITEHTRISKTSPAFTIGFDRFGSLLGITIGYLLAYITFGNQITSTLAFPYIPSIIVGALILITMFVFDGHYPYQYDSSGDHKNGKLLLDPHDANNPGPWRSKCIAFSSEHRLTPREEEVLLLLAKGRDTSHIEERLVISSHTVKAHIYNIYKKTEVHSRQELITLIEDFSEEL